MPGGVAPHTPSVGARRTPFAIARGVTYPRPMRTSGPAPKRRGAWILPALALAVTAVIGAAIWHPWSSPAADPATVIAGDGAVAVLPQPAPLDLPEQPTVLIFGDSWTYGSAATEPTLGYAYVVAGLAGWTTIVDGVRGSGYLRPGLDGADFGTRMAALDPALDPDLVIVQGSINDRTAPAEGYRAAVDAAWDALVETYPRAQIVILGPAPQVLPVEPATARIDRDLAAAAAARGWWYLSPLEDDWITPANYAVMIDTGIGHDHPSTEGHRALAERLAESVESISR